MLIAIDGPVAVGKSTVGRLIGKKLGFPFLDTGLMYRALTWKVLEKNMELTDEEKIIELTCNLDMQLIFSGDNSEAILKIDRKELRDEVRSTEVEKAVSLISRLPRVRKFMVSQQQRVAKSLPNLVMAGRDIGTVVLPKAEKKYYLTASPEIRAARRFKELEERGEHKDYNSVLKQIEVRDELDSKRAIAPLRPAKDACIINTDNLSAEQVVEKILAKINYH